MRLSYKKAYINSSFVLLFIPAIPAHAVSSEHQGESIIGVTDTDIVLLITYVLMALGFSFLCSIAEAVLLSMTPSYIEAQREKHPRLANQLKRLKLDNIDRSLAAILTLNTIAHTVGAIAAGAKAAFIFGSAWFGVFSAVMTLMILFLSEILPKTIGAIHWAKFAGPTVFFVRSLIIILFPLVWISERLTYLISRGKKMNIFSRDEFIAMTHVGEQSGHINDNESRIIQNLFRLGSLKVTEIMTPRTVISALHEDETIMGAFTYVTQKPFSRLPLYRKDIDNITGFVLRDDILLKKAQERSEDVLKTFKRDIITVPESASLSMLMERFLKERQHIAIVVDEYGGTSGLVTLEDLVETLIGVEIMDEIDKVEDMRTLARKLWIERAKARGIESEFSEKTDTV